MILSILIPTTSDRETYFANVVTELCRQVRVLSEWYEKDYWQYVQILQDTRPQPVSIGAKRNALLEQATGEWVAFVDSDDMVATDYIRTILSEVGTIRSYVNCLSLRGVLTENGGPPQIFEHSVKYNEWLTKPDAPCKYEEHSVKYSDWQRDNSIAFDKETKLPIKYERYPNHLNTIRASVAKQFRFPETSHGEDHAWSKALHESGLLKSEGYIDKILYYYLYRSNK